MSELSRRTGVSVATIKYYLREGLLPPGELTTTNQATYGDEHAHRLRLVRVLREVGGLSIAAIREVLVAIDDPSRSLHEVIGVAHRALSPSEHPPPAEDDEVRAWVGELGWQVANDAPALGELARALASLRALGRDVDASTFLPHAEAAERLARQEVASLPADAPRTELVERVVVGTVVYEAALVALRRLAQEHHSTRLLAGRDRPDGT